MPKRKIQESVTRNLPKRQENGSASPNAHFLRELWQEPGTFHAVQKSWQIQRRHGKISLQTHRIQPCRKDSKREQERGWRASKSVSGTIFPLKSEQTKRARNGYAAHKRQMPRRHESRQILLFAAPVSSMFSIHIHHITLINNDISNQKSVLSATILLRLEKTHGFPVSSRMQRFPYCIKKNLDKYWKKKIDISTQPCPGMPSLRISGKLPPRAERLKSAPATWQKACGSHPEEETSTPPLRYSLFPELSFWLIGT